MDKLEQLADGEDAGSKWMEDFIKAEKPSDKDFRKARVVTSFLATQVRAHAAIVGRDRVRFSIARVITDDTEALKKYMGLTAPSSGGQAIESK